MYSDQELGDVHFMYCLADGNTVVADCLYQEIYPERKTFVKYASPPL
jgi:hypothetical protein